MPAVRSTPVRRSARPPTRGIAVPREVLAAKPWSDDDVAAIHELAGRLAGEPVPGWRLTAAQFIDWCEPEVKAEWVEGEVVLMTPEGWGSVDFITWLSAILRTFIEDRQLGALAGREILTRLPNQRRLRAPDLQYIAKSRVGIIHDTVVEGAPDLVIECVSPSSVVRDWRLKHAEYEKAGVREYWVFDPLHQAVEAYALGKDKKYAVIRERDGKVASKVLKGFYFRRSWIQAAKRPTVSSVLKEMAGRRG